MKSIEMTVENLIDSFKGVEKARKEMHLGQNLAGMALPDAILGIVHSMALKTGKIFNVPHGLANAIYLCNSVQY